MRTKITEEEWAERKAATKERRRVRKRKYKRRQRAENIPFRLWYSAQNRARERRIAFTIKISDVVVPTHCPVLGIELKIAIGVACGQPNSPSLDRIDNKYGYIPGNVVVMSNRANKLKGDATAEELRKVAAWASANQLD